MFKRNKDKLQLFLTFPNNPTGYCPTPDEMKQIVEKITTFCESSKKSVIILCDDAYEGYTFDSNVSANSIFYELVNIHPLIIPLKLDGTSKEMLMYGGTNRRNHLRNSRILGFLQKNLKLLMKNGEIRFKV